MAKKSKILIIEDEEYLADLYKMKFEQEGFSVIIAREGDEGLALARKKSPDLVLLDLVMPGKDGYEVLEEMRSDPVTKNLRIYILSNLGQEDEVEQGKAAGADDFLVKANLTPEQLTAKVKEALAMPPGGKIGATLKDNNEEEQKQPHQDKQILLIEDDSTLQEMYALRLRQDGCHVSTAGNGAWGLRLANDKKFDLIVMDMMMPAMHGYELLDKIRKESVNKDTPVIVVSNSAQDKDIQEAKSHGAVAYFLKSQITPAKLSKEAANLLSLK